jgi:Globin
MVADMSYKTCSSVINSWEEVRLIKNYEEILGIELFANFFDQEPAAKRIFGFRESQSTKELIESRRFTKHAAYFVQMVSRCTCGLADQEEK